MTTEVRELLTKKDIQVALEALKATNDNARLVYADYINEKRLREMQYISEEAWQLYLDELYIRVKQLRDEREIRDPLINSSPNKDTGTSKENATKPKLFISYNHQDQEIVNRIAMYLDGRIAYFVDYVSMNPGDNIRDRIKREILDCDYFLVIISKNSLGSPWVCLEGMLGDIKAQWLKGKLIPVRVDDSLENNNFLAGLVKQIHNKVKRIDVTINRIKTFSPGRKHLDTERELYTDFLKNNDSMLDTYRKTANINISGDLFEYGMQNLIKSILQ